MIWPSIIQWSIVWINGLEICDIETEKGEEIHEYANMIIL